MKKYDEAILHLNKALEIFETSKVINKQSLEKIKSHIDYVKAKINQSSTKQNPKPTTPPKEEEEKSQESESEDSEK